MRQVPTWLASGVIAMALAAALAGTASATHNSGSRFAVYNPYAPDQTKLDKVQVNRLLVFGDSYSDPSFGNYDNWAEQLNKNGTATYLSDFARSGATAFNGPTAGFPTNSLRQQLDYLDATRLPYRWRDLTIVYLGYNDINRLSNLDASKAEYRAGVDRLISKGATGSDRRMFLALQHNMNRDPVKSWRVKNNLPAWNSFVAGVANARSRVIAVDLYTAFERVYANPGKYGLVNVTTPNAARSAIDYLYYDDRHFGAKGHKLISQVYRHYLTRGWDWANTLSTGSATVSRLNQDITNGLVFRDPALVDPTQPGLGVVALGPAALSLAEAWPDEPSAAPFGNEPNDADDGAIALTQRLGDASSLALVVGSYTGSDGSRTAFGSASYDTESRLSGLVLQHAIGDWQLATSLIHADQRHQRRDYDELVGSSVDASFGGRTLRLGQRLGYVAEGMGATWRPWLELSYQRQESDSFTIADPFVSDVTYSAEPVDETMLTLGLAADSHRIALDGWGDVRLHAGVAYHQSLMQDDYRVSIQEAAVRGYTQEEVIERPAVRGVSLDLGGVWDVTPAVALSAGYAVGAPLDGTDGSKAEQRVTVGLSLHF
jgi:phospholipase/lecithinase/hemolysin